MFIIINFLFFAQKVSSVMGALREFTSQIFRGLAELEHPQDWRQRGSNFFFIAYFHYLFI